MAVGLHKGVFMTGNEFSEDWAICFMMQALHSTGLMTGGEQIDTPCDVKYTFVFV